MLDFMSVTKTTFDCRANVFQLKNNQDYINVFIPFISRFLKICYGFGFTIHCTQTGKTDLYIFILLIKRVIWLDEGRFTLLNTLLRSANCWVIADFQSAMWSFCVFEVNFAL